MRILLANPRGFCAGVDRAIEIVEIALRRYGAPVYVRHEIVHNQHVVETLRAKGAIFIEDPAEVPKGSLLVYSAHGVAPSVRKAAEAQELRTIDATCPLVTKVHVEAKRFVREDVEIALIGHAGHVEVDGTLGHAPETMHLIEDVADVEKLEVKDPAKLAVLTQTTLSVDDTREVMDALKARFPEVRLPRTDDICYATQNRQNAVKELIKEADLVLVVTSRKSSNGNRLAEITLKLGTAAHLVQTADEIDPAWLEGVSCVGVTSAASTPEILVEQVVARLRELGGGDSRVDSLPEVDEGMLFSLPLELRGANA